MARSAHAFAAKVADTDVMSASPVHNNYMVYKDGRPFLIVNATLAHVDHLVQRFALYEAEYNWTFAPHID